MSPRPSDDPVINMRAIAVPPLAGHDCPDRSISALTRVMSRALR